MATQVRFLQAADNTRPFKSHRYDVFGLKIDRMLFLYGRLPLHAWILLEADPSVTAYCERPIVIPDTKPKRVVDFWVRRGNQEEIWFLQRSSEIAAEKGIRELMPAFSSWAETQKIKIKYISPAELDEQKLFLDNWGQIIRDLSSNKRFLTPRLVSQVNDLVDVPCTISAIGACLADEDPVLIKTAIFSLIHAGKLHCHNIASVPLGLSSTVEAI